MFMNCFYIWIGYIIINMHSLDFTQYTEWFSVYSHNITKYCIHTSGEVDGF